VTAAGTSVEVGLVASGRRTRVWWKHATNWGQ
jgi:hypothetical protein